MKKAHLFIAGTMCLFALLLCTSSTLGQNITLAITGIKSIKGQIVVSVFKDNKSFKDEQPAMSFQCTKASLINGSMTVSLTLEPGTYGIAVLDDEDSNGKMEKNMLGIPKEGFGFSNFYLSGMRRPVFDDFKWEVKNTPVKLESKMRYM